MTAAIVLLFIVVGLPWNIMVVITAVKKRLYHQPTIMLLLNLVVTDILMILIYFPIVTVTWIAGKYIFGSTDMMRCQTCKLAAFVRVALLLDGLFVVALISIDRLLYIYIPIRYEQKANKRRALLSIALTTMLSIAIGLMALVIPGTINYDAGVFCLNTVELFRYWYIIFLITVAFVTLTVITVCNIWVICIVLKNIKAVYKIRRSSCSREKRKSHMQYLSGKLREKRHKKQLHLFRVFGGLLLSNIIAWFPRILVSVLDMSKVNLSLSYFSFADIFFLSQVVLHPILETTLIADLREPLMEMVTCGIRKKKKDNHDSTKEQIHFCCLCCRSAEVYGDDHCNCSVLLKMIDAAVLPKDNSGCYRASTHDSVLGTS